MSKVQNEGERAFVISLRIRNHNIGVKRKSSLVDSSPPVRSSQPRSRFGTRTSSPIPASPIFEADQVFLLSFFSSISNFRYPALPSSRAHLKKAQPIAQATYCPPLSPTLLLPSFKMPALNPNALFPDHDLSNSFSFPKEEEKVLEFWKDIDAFQESIRQSEGRPQYSFYDGPPFATGLPHHGHILMGTVKVS